MSLIRQLWLLVLAVLLAAIVGAIAVNLVGTRAVLQTQLASKNADNAQSLALVLSQQGGERSLIELLLSAQFDTGVYRSIRLIGADGKPIIERQAAAHAQRAPAWLERLLPIESPVGIAQVSNGWQPLGQVEVVSQVAYAYDALWRSGQRTALVMLGIGVVAALALLPVVARIRRPLDAMVAQAASLEEGRYVTIAEPPVRELKRVAAALNHMVARVRQLFDAHAQQIDVLQREAHCDRLTALPHRQHFVAALDTAFAREDGPREGGLVLLRLADLAGINRIYGRGAVDAALNTIANVLRAYPQRVSGCVAARLNGADFALWLPTSGIAAETAASIVAALRSALPAYGQALQVQCGVVEAHGVQAPTELLSRADLALARAEAKAPFAVELADAGAASNLGEREWRTQLVSALADRRVQLVEFAVLDNARRLVHLECPLRLQLQPGQAPAPAAQWLPQALRHRLSPQVDLLATTLALEAIARDGQPRAVNVAPASVAMGGFAGNLQDLLRRHARAARALWVEVAESAAIDHFDALHDFARTLRLLGVRVGIEHAGARLHRIDRLHELGLDYVKLDAALCTGIGASRAVQGALRGSVALLHALAIEVHAEGIGEPADADALWACGVDAVTGPWASTRYAGGTA